MLCKVTVHKMSELYKKEKKQRHVNKIIRYVKSNRKDKAELTQRLEW